MLIQRLVRYCKALGVVGGLLTLLGIAPFFVDDILNFYFRANISIPTIVLVVWFIFAFGAANFRVYEDTQRTKLELRPERTNVALTSSWMVVSQDGFSIADTIEVTFTIWFEVTNPLQSPTFAELSINSVESEWQTSIDLQNVNFIIEGQPVRSDNRLKIQPLGSRLRRVDFAIPFDSPDDRLDFGYLGSLSEIVVELAVKEQGREKQAVLPLSFDVAAMHKEMEVYFIRQGCHWLAHLDNRGRQEDVLIFVNTLKKYWGIDKPHRGAA